MVLFAKRVRANFPPEKRTSTSSALESFRMRSKMSAAWSGVSIQDFAVSSQFSFSRTLKRTSHHNVSKSCGRCPMARAHYLLRLPLATIRGSPQCPFITRANRIHGIPKLSRDARIRRVFHHAHAFAILDLPANLAAELKVIALVVNRPRPIRLHQNSVIGSRNKLLEREWFICRQDAYICHADHGQPIPALGAQSSARPVLPDGVRCLAGTQISREQSICDD